MAFELTVSQETEQKFRLNLSPLAKDTIEMDVVGFANGCDTGTFINIILENYIPEAQASIGRILRQEDLDLQECLSGLPEETQIISKLIERKKHQLQEQHVPKGSGSHTYRLRDSVINMLKSIECEEEEYYSGKVGKYLKAVIEEYARLPYRVREGIFFAERLRDIERAIKDHCLLEVQISTSKTFTVIPHAIVQDPMDTTNYMVCFSAEYDPLSKNEMQPSSFRISRLKSIRIISAKAHLSDSQKAFLVENIKTRGVEFLSYADEKIVVRLNQRGREKYESLRHLRPRYIDVNGDLYTFNCTLNQAEFYFFKFGKDAEIVEPRSLRERFAELYWGSYSVYK